MHIGATNEPDKEETKLITKLQERVRKAQSELKKETKLIKKRRAYMRGEFYKDGERKVVRSNLIYSTIDNIIPHIYAKNPEVSVRPSPALDASQYPAIDGFCETIEIVIQRLLRDAGLKKKAKRTVKASLVTGKGWVKVSYQRDIRKDQIIIDRISDAQDNIQRLRHEIQEIGDGDCSDKENELQEIELLVKSLEGKAEVVFSEGIALDTIRQEDMIVDPSISSVGDYHLARWICQRIYMNKDDAESIYGIELDKATTYTSENDEWEDGKDSSGELVIIYEMWDKTNNHVFTFTDGYDGWVREPYVPTRCGEKFYPFVPLVILDDDEGKDISMIDMLMELQDEYNETRKKFAEHREANVPHWIGDSSIRVEDVKNFSNAAAGDITIIDTGGRALDSMIIPAPRIPVDYANYDTSLIRMDMDMISGVQDAMRGAIGKAKTATEASIMQAGASGRIGAMQDAIEDWLQEVFKLTAEICLQEMDATLVQKYAGVNAVWTQLPKEDVFNMVNIEIRAGSSGKPDKVQERESWAQIMPLLQEMYVKVVDIESNGGDAEPLRKIMRETLKRFDERIDVDDFIPSRNETMNYQMAQQGV